MLQLLFPDQEPELCADGIALDGGGAFLLGTRLVNPDELEAAAAEPRPANPGLTTFVPLRPPVLGWPHLLDYLSMQPSASLDKAVFFLPPSVVGVRSLSGLGRDADHLGLPVQFPAGQLTDEPPGALESAEHRVLYLDKTGNPVDATGAETVQVLPLERRGSDAYDDVAAGPVRLAEAQRLTRIVHTPAGVQLGVAPGLVNRMLETLRGGPASRPAEPVVSGAELGDVAFAAAGATAIGTAEGYVDLLRGVRDLPTGRQALIVVDGAAPVVHLVGKDLATGSLMDVDVETAAAGLLPTQPGRIRFAEVPAGMSLAEALAHLRGELYGIGAAPSWAATTRDGLDLLQWIAGDGTEHTVEVLGSAVGLPAVGRPPQERVDEGGLQQDLMDLAEQSGRSIVVLGVERPGDPVPAGLLPKLEHRAGVRLLDGDVPLVVTTGAVTAELLDTLDSLHADLAYQAPGLTDGSLLANLGAPPWAVRKPGPEPDQVMAAVADDLADAAILSAVRQRPEPAFAAPIPTVSALMTRPFTDVGGLREALSNLRSQAPAQLPVVKQLAELAPAFKAPAALLGMDIAGDGEAALRFIRDRKIPGSVLKPLQDMPENATPAERELRVKTMLPQLAALAEHGLNDPVSTTIAETLSDMLSRNVTQAEVRDKIFTLAGKLVNKPDVREKWVTGLNEVARLLPQHVQSLTWAIEAIVACP
jgi:hypothetical protein